MKVAEKREQMITGAASSELENWLDQHGDALFRYALLRVQNEHTAEDLVQETFLAAVRGAKSFKGNSSVKTWLVGILKHKIVDHYRKTSRENTVSYDNIGEEGLINQSAPGSTKFQGASDSYNWGTDPVALLQQKDFMGVLYHCLSGLSPRLKDVFSMREFDQLSTEEISKALGITSTNLWVMLHRARLGLRSCLEVSWFSRKTP